MLIISFFVYIELNLSEVSSETSGLSTMIDPGLGKGELIDSEVKLVTENTGDLTIDDASFNSFEAIKIGEQSKVAQVPQEEKLGIQIRDVRGTGESLELKCKNESI